MTLQNTVTEFTSDPLVIIIIIIFIVFCVFGLPFVFNLMIEDR